MQKFFFQKKIHYITETYTKKEYTYYDCNGGNERRERCDKRNMKILARYLHVLIESETFEILYAFRKICIAQ